MCGILFTTKDLSGFNLDFVIEFLKKRGPDSTSIKNINGYTFIHTLLSMTGPPTEQPFYNSNKDIVCIFNGEIYNFEDFGKYKSDGECLVPLYEKYGDDFINKLDGEFAIILVDFKRNILIFSTDIFSTRPLWIGFDDKHFGLSTYKSCLDRIGLENNYQILANKTYFLDLNNIKIIKEQNVHMFDLKQFKTTFDDWNTAFSNSIKKRTKYAKCGIFIGMSGGYDSGAIACELTKQSIPFTAYSITNVEDKEIMEKRKQLVKNTKLIEVSRDSFLEAREYLKKNAEEYKLNIDNGEKSKYFDMVTSDSYDQNKANELLKIMEFRESGQLLTDDNGGIGCSYICSLAIKQNEKIYLSGSGADEIFSDYGFNKIKYFDHSTIGGYFPEDLSSVFPWKNFFENTQRAYLMKEEHVAGSYGIEGRYPFLDKFVVQEFLWLSNELKNQNYKSPLDNYLHSNNFPYEKNQKIGFGCGFSGPSPNNVGYETLNDSYKKSARERKVTDISEQRKVNFEKIESTRIKSFEKYYILKKQNMVHVEGNCYKALININYPGLKYYDGSEYVVLEDNKELKYPVKNINLISENGLGLFSFQTSTTVYFSTSDNSNPITNNKTYAIVKMKNRITGFKYKNTNAFNKLKYYFAIVIKDCYYDSEKYLKIRHFLNEYNFLPKVLICDNCEIFRDVNNIFLSRHKDDNSVLLTNTRVIITDEENFISNNSLYLFDENLNDDFEKMIFSPEIFDDNYSITRGNNPCVTIGILSLDNKQFRYALKSALKQQKIDFTILLIKNHSCANAMNNFIDRIETKYGVQMDEDMIFFDEYSLNNIVKIMKSQNDNTWFYCFSLKDLIFGIGDNYQILGIKIFNIELIKNKKLRYEDSKLNFAIDRVIQTTAKNLGLESKCDMLQVGWHQKCADEYDLFLRCLKIGYEVFVSNIQHFGFYEYSMFIKFLTAFEINDLLIIIKYFLDKYSSFTKKNYSALSEIFLNKIKNLVTPLRCLEDNGGHRGHHKIHHIDMNKHFEYLKLLKNMSINDITINMNHIKLNELYNNILLNNKNNVYCLIGMLASMFIDDIMSIYGEKRNYAEIRNFFYTYIYVTI